MSIKAALYPVNLLSDNDLDWVVERRPFTDVGTETADKMMAGYLVKKGATGDGVEPALAADDAALYGVIVDLPEKDETSKTVAVLLHGSVNQNQVHYANAHAESPPAALSAAAVDRLRQLSIFLRPAVSAAPFAP